MILIIQLIFYLTYRLEIYKEFIALLDHLYNQSISNPLTPTIPSKPGPPPQNSTMSVTPAKEIVKYTSFFS